MDLVLLTDFGLIIKLTFAQYICVIDADIDFYPFIERIVIIIHQSLNDIKM